MPKPKKSPNKRKNMNLTKKTFNRLSRLKARREGELGFGISWDGFFGQHLTEYDLLKQREG